MSLLSVHHLLAISFLHPSIETHYEGPEDPWATPRDSLETPKETPERLLRDWEKTEVIQGHSYETSEIHFWCYWLLRYSTKTPENFSYGLGSLENEIQWLPENLKMTCIGLAKNHWILTWMEQLFNKFENAVFVEYFKFLLLGNSNGSKTNPKKNFLKISQKTRPLEEVEILAL